MNESIGFSKKITVEIDGAPVTEGKIPVVLQSEVPVAIINSNVLPVTPGIMKTHHIFSYEAIEKASVGSTYVTVKTIDLENKFLRELLFSVDRKDITVKVSIDGNQIVELQIDFLYDFFNHGGEQDISDSFSVYRSKGGNYGIRLTYNNNKVCNNLTIEVKKTNGSPKDVVFQGIVYIYNEKVESI